MDIETFIKSVQSRPLMYVEEVKIEYIYYLIVGFLGSNLINQRGYDIDQNFKSNFMQWVYDWVLKNVNRDYERKSFFWYHIIKEITNSEEEAVNLFFELSDTFFRECKIGVKNNKYLE